MAKQVQVILLENVDSMGSAGEIVSVSEGHARNFLFPQGKAALATANVQSQYEHRKERAAKAEKEKLIQLREQADSWEGTELNITVKVKEGDELYGSIGKKDIAEELNKQVDLKLNSKNVVLEEPIKKLGSYPTIIQLSPEVEAKIIVTVVAEEEKTES